MNEKILVFIGGIIFAVVTASKAYAPNRDEQLGSTPTPPPPQPNTGRFNECPEGQKREAVMKCMAMTPECMNAPDYRCVDDIGTLPSGSCAPGFEKKPVFRKMYGMKPPEEKLERDRIAFEEAQRNAPCISNKEAAAIRMINANAPIPPSVRPRGTMLGFTG